MRTCSALVVQWIEWEIPNFQIGVRFPSEVLRIICSFIFCLLGRRSQWLWLAVFLQKNRSRTILIAFDLFILYKR